MNPIFLIDREITFSIKFQDNKNVELFVLNPESMVTDYGFFIPTCADGLGILDYLDFGPGGPKPRYKASTGILIDSLGNIRWLYMKPEWIEDEDLSPTKIYPQQATQARLFANRVIYGHGNRRAFGFNETVQKLAFLSMEVKDKINDVLEFFEKGIPAPKTTWHTYNIDEIVNYLKVNRPSKSIPNNWMKNIIEDKKTVSVDEAINKISTNLDSMLKTSL